MVNFLDICKQVEDMAGGHGTILNVENAVGLHKNIVSAVKSCYQDLQTYRDNWIFMRRTVEFMAAPDKSYYSLFDIFDNPSSTESLVMLPDLEMLPELEMVGSEVKDLAFGRWAVPYDTKLPLYHYADTPSSGKKPIAYMPWTHFRMYSSGDSVSGVPSLVSFDYKSVLYFHSPPKKSYTLFADYYLKPQLLKLNSDVPIIPPEYWDLICYKAASRICRIIGNHALANEYARDAIPLVGGLLRSQCPHVNADVEPIA